MLSAAPLEGCFCFAGRTSLLRGTDSAADLSEPEGMLAAHLCGTWAAAVPEGKTKGAATPTYCCMLLCGEAHPASTLIDRANQHWGLHEDNEPCHYTGRTAAPGCHGEHYLGHLLMCLVADTRLKGVSASPSDPSWDLCAPPCSFTACIATALLA